MSGGRAGFEVQAFRNEHWVTEDICESENQARTACKTVLGKAQVGGVRILKTWRRADGQVTENVVFTEMRAAENPKVTISPIEEAPPCAELADYYRLESRTTIGRILRKYVEQVFLTPTELLHNHKALKKLQEVDTLFPAAVDRVATVQAKVVGQDVRVRRDELYRVVAQATARAKRADENSALPTLKGNDFAAAFERVKRAVPPDELDYFAKVVLSRDLVQQRAWLSKLERVSELVNPGYAAEVLAPLDGVLADLMATPAALQDMIGQQRNLGTALMAIADLYESGKPAEKSDAREQIERFGPLIAEGKLSETRQSLLERLVRQVAGTQPLSRNEPAKEQEAYAALVARMFGANGLLGGPAAAAALTRRYVLLLETGGQTALRQAVGGVLGAIRDVRNRVGFLLQLTASDLGKDLNEPILANLRRMVAGPDIHALVGRDQTPKEKLVGVKRVYDDVKACEALPMEERGLLLDALDAALTDYIRREGIIERLDDPQARLRDRAIRLVQFCGEGLLPDGRALREARERVITHLRRPNFDQAFLEGVTDPAKGAELIREFHSTLVRAGFR